MVLVLVSTLVVLGFFSLIFLYGSGIAKSVLVPGVYLLVPVWISYRFGGVELDVRFVFFFAVTLYCAITFQPKNPVPFSPIDALFFLLVCGMLLSQYKQGYFGPSTVPEILRKWAFPYILGRLFVNSWNGIIVAEPCLRWLLVLLIGLALFEPPAHFNPLQALFRKTYPLLEAGEGYRWGLKRAMGAMSHPIFFGMALVCLLPWSLLTAQRALRGSLSQGWVLLPVFHGLAICATASRGAILAAFMALGGVAFVSWPKARLGLGLLGAILVPIFLFWKEEGMEILGSWAGDNTPEEVREVMIDDVIHQYTGTAHRVLLFKVYADAMEKAGWFGFGVNHFEGMSRAGISFSPEVEQRFGSIDNGFLYLLLQHGWLAILLFCAFGLVLLGTAWFKAFTMQNKAGTFLASLSACLAAVWLGLNSVWFSADFSALWLFHAGLLTTLPRLDPNEGQAQVPPPRNSMGFSRKLPKL